MKPTKTRARKTKSVPVLVLHGPNLNLLGEREPEVYGDMTLAQLNTRLKTESRRLGLALKIFQSNSEGRLIDLIHAHRRWAHAIVINPGAYTHYSYAIRDALASVQPPTYEVHLSDIQSREEFRKVSVIAPVCRKQISGLGWKSYLTALEEISQGRENGR
jgi:3-dehydroquinate dehydratase-2